MKDKVLEQQSHEIDRASASASLNANRFRAGERTQADQCRSMPRHMSILLAVRTRSKHPHWVCHWFLGPVRLIFRRRAQMTTAPHSNHSSYDLSACVSWVPLLHIQFPRGCRCAKSCCEMGQRYMPSMMGKAYYLGHVVTQS